MDWHAAAARPVPSLCPGRIIFVRGWPAAGPQPKTFLPGGSGLWDADEELAVAAALGSSLPPEGPPPVPAAGDARRLIAALPARPSGPQLLAVSDAIKDAVDIADGVTASYGEVNADGNTAMGTCILYRGPSSHPPPLVRRSAPEKKGSRLISATPGGPKPQHCFSNPGGGGSSPRHKTRGRLFHNTVFILVSTSVGRYIVPKQSILTKNSFQ